jgi:hypothetical protein
VPAPSIRAGSGYVGAHPARPAHNRSPSGVNSVIASDAGNGTATTPVQRRLRVLDSGLGVIHRRSHRRCRGARSSQRRGRSGKPAPAVRSPRERRLRAASVDEELTGATRQPRDRFDPGVAFRAPTQPGERREPTPFGRAAALLLALESFLDVAWLFRFLKWRSARRAERRRGRCGSAKVGIGTSANLLPRGRCVPTYSRDWKSGPLALNARGRLGRPGP